MPKASYTKENKEFFSFGKYKNKFVKWVLKTDPEYIKFVKEKTNREFSEEIETEIRRIKLC